MKIRLNDQQWKNFKSKVRFKWSRVKDYEIEKSRGKIKYLVNKIKSRYRLNCRKTEEQVKKILLKSK